MPTATFASARQRSEHLLSAMNQHAIPTASEVDEARKSHKARVMYVDKTLEALAHSLEARLGQLEAAESALAREAREDAEVRGARDARKEGLGQLLSQLAEAVHSAWGREVVVRLSLEGRTPQNTAALLTAARAVLVATDPMPELPPPTSAWNAPDLDGARAALLALTREVEAELSALAEDTRQTQLARAARDEALAAWRREFALASAFTRALLDYAGKSDLAARVLGPRARRAGGDDPEGDDPTLDVDAPLEPNLPSEPTVA